MALSKSTRFVREFLRSDGTSDLIRRYSLPDYCAYTSGDGIFRSDGCLGNKYRFFRYSKRLDFKKCSNAMRGVEISSELRDRITRTHASLSFERSGPTVEYIQFFGLATEYEDTKAPIRADIRRTICAMPCSNCGTQNDIQCDHKNDLYNDPRVTSLDTQTVDDFQPLCRHCNGVKREVKARMLDTKKRYGASQLGFPVDFTHGDDTLDLTNPMWYVGTYWGDCLAFKRVLTLTRS
jgi:hypothetical protein